MISDWHDEVISVDELAFDLANPRHEKLKTPEEVIRYMVEKEKVVELAISIADEGSTNPLDRMGVVRKKNSNPPVYIAYEGNRRTCALMLLHDPEKIPTGVVGREKRIKAIERAAAKANLPSTINVVVFKNSEGPRRWIKMMHVKDDEPRGRRRWSPDQQGRAIAGGRNYDAIQLLDLAEKFGLIGAEERAQKLTTVQRYLGNPLVRKALGLKRASSDKKLLVDLTPEAFDAVLKSFIGQVRAGKLSSRSDRTAIENFAADFFVQTQTVDRKGGQSFPLEDFRPPETVSPPDEEDQDDKTGDDDRPTPLDPPPPPPKRLAIGRNGLVEAVLFPINSQKLNSLYMSCTGLPLKDHTPLITVGLWSLLESLAALHAKEPKRFLDYFTPNFFSSSLGIQDKETRKNIRAAIEEVDAKGNATKHNGVAAGFDGQQLANNFDVLAPMITAVCATISR